MRGVRGDDATRSLIYCDSEMLETRRDRERKIESKGSDFLKRILIF